MNRINSLLSISLRFSLSKQQLLHKSLCTSASRSKQDSKAYRVTSEASVKKKPLIQAWTDITPQDLARQMNRSFNDVDEAMFLNDIYNFSNFKDVIKVCKVLGFRCDQIKDPADVETEKSITTTPTAGILIPRSGKTIQPRPPVVTIMGHVDHGKTTLLDQLRKSEIAKSEFGGITQHIGAFVVSLSDPDAVRRSNTHKQSVIKNMVTFLDTPGHAAFHAMRQRGAHITDIVVLVIAAEDGIMNQTIESLNFAKQANVPIVVAINKIDRVNMRDPKALDHVKMGLFSQGIILEEDGGETQVIKMSALEGIGIEELKESLIALAETLNLKSPVDGDVVANVIESSVHAHRGRLATLLVRSGTLKKGDILVSTSDETLSWAKVRCMFNEFGHVVETVTPGLPVQVTGWKDNLIPDAGDQMFGVQSEKQAKEYLSYKKEQKMQRKSLSDSVEGAKRYEFLREDYLDHLKSKRSNELLRARYQRYRTPVDLIKIHKDDEDDDKRINIILKCDVKGSLEVLVNVLSSYPNDNEIVKVNLIHDGIGPVNESDLELASIFKNTIIYSFNLMTPEAIDKTAKQDGISIKTHRVIYHLVNDVKEEIDQKLPELDQEIVVGEALVLQEFLISDRGSKKVPVAGVKVTKGSLKKGEKFLYKVVKSSSSSTAGSSSDQQQQQADSNQMVINNLSLTSMRHLKDEVESVKKDFECGLKFDLKPIKSSYPDFKFQPGDRMICYTIQKVKQKTKWTPDGF